MTDDKKQELMTQFCIAYCGILAKHTLCATNTTGNMIKDATGLEASLFQGLARGDLDWRNIMYPRNSQKVL